MLTKFKTWFGGNAADQSHAIATEPEQSHKDLVLEAATSHRDGIKSLERSRMLLKKIYPYMVEADDSVLQSAVLNEKIQGVLARYQSDPDVYKYFHGHPYQGLGIAGVFGDRVCDYRFDHYELRNFIKLRDRVLDIGCNCGFMAILAAYRIGCKGYGVDINPYMIEIGDLVIEHLNLSDQVNLAAVSLQEFEPEEPFDVVMSFATHWTDDENYRVQLADHMQRMASYLKVGGTLIFETHCNDVGNERFYAAMEEARKIFFYDGVYKITDSDTRELYIMTKC